MKTVVQTKAQVFSLLHQHQQELQQFGVQRCGVFGSFVRDAAIHEQSDVDVQDETLKRAYVPSIEVIEAVKQ